MIFTEEDNLFISFTHELTLREIELRIRAIE
jgi:hypothetical protein